MFLTVNLVDRLLSKLGLKRTFLQLVIFWNVIKVFTICIFQVGGAALWIASKFEEVNYLECADIVFVCAGTYTVKDVLLMEKLIMKTLDFRLICANSYLFAKYFLNLAQFEDSKLESLVVCILELQLQSYEILIYSSCVRAIASIFIAVKTLSIPDDSLDRWLKSVSYCPETLVFVFCLVPSKLMGL